MPDPPDPPGPPKPDPEPTDPAGESGPEHRGHGWHGGHGGHGRHGGRHRFRDGRAALEERQAARWARRRRPPWWPEGEPWPPTRPPWQVMPRHFRRRFLLGALALLALLVGVIFVVALATRDWGNQWGWGGHDRRPAESQPGGDGRRPGGLLFVVGGVVAVGGIATALAYRRISRPVGDLLGAAQRVAEGDYDVTVRPDGPRELRLLTSTFNDMTTRLAVSDEQRRRFLADVTHELRTPLAVLQTGVEAQLDGIHPRDDQHLGSLLEEIQRLGRLVDDLHTLALAEAGRIVLHREPVAPASLVDEAIEAHAPLAGQKGVTVRAEVVEGVPDVVDVDPVRIRQVLDNLLSNAVRHTPAGREVVVQVAPAPPGTGPAPGVRITVADAGPGFPPDQLASVFERFTRSADSGGSGLGLSIARDLVQAHGGTIQAGNDPATGGATVSFTL